MLTKEKEINAISKIFSYYMEMLDFKKFNTAIFNSLDILINSKETFEFDFVFQFDNTDRLKLEYAYNAHGENIRDRIIRIFDLLSYDVKSLSKLFEDIPSSYTVVGFEWYKTALPKIVIYFECLEKYYTSTEISKILENMNANYNLSLSPPDNLKDKLSIIAIEYKNKKINNGKLYFKLYNLEELSLLKSPGKAHKQIFEKINKIFFQGEIMFYLLAYRFNQNNKLKGIKIYKAYNYTTSDETNICQILTETKKFLSNITASASQIKIYNNILNICKKENVCLCPTSIAYNFSVKNKNNYGNVYLTFV